MDKLKVSGAAFPNHPEMPVGAPGSGMSLLDYFAAQVLPVVYKDALDHQLWREYGDQWRTCLAADCYLMANEMIKVKEMS